MNEAHRSSRVTSKRAKRKRKKPCNPGFLHKCGSPTSMSMRIDTPDDESAIRQPTDNIPPRDVIRTFMAARRSRGRWVALWCFSHSLVRPAPLSSGVMNLSVP